MNDIVVLLGFLEPELSKDGILNVALDFFVLRDHPLDWSWKIHQIGL